MFWGPFLFVRCRWWACKPAPIATSEITNLVRAATPQLAIEPAGPVGASSTAAAEAATAAVTSARAALQDVKWDVVAVSAPRRAQSGSAPTIAITVNRQGSPLAGATVYVQIATRRNGKTTTVTVPVTTQADGTATVAVPVSVQGTKGARSVVEAFTNDARAMGAKGTVSVLSTRNRITWV